MEGNRNTGKEKREKRREKEEKTGKMKSDNERKGDIEREIQRGRRWREEKEREEVGRYICEQRKGEKKRVLNSLAMNASPIYLIMKIPLKVFYKNIRISHKALQEINKKQTHYQTNGNKQSDPFQHIHTLTQGIFLNIEHGGFDNLKSHRRKTLTASRRRRKEKNPSRPWPWDV